LSFNNTFFVYFFNSPGRAGIVALSTTSPDVFITKRVKAKKETPTIRWMLYFLCWASYAACHDPWGMGSSFMCPGDHHAGGLYAELDLTADMATV